MRYQRNSAACDLTLARFGLRTIPAMHPSATRGKTAECVAKHDSESGLAGGSES